MTVTILGGSNVSEPSSRLHDRHTLGCRPVGRAHSVAPRKWTTCPLLATGVAEHMYPASRRAA